MEEAYVWDKEQALQWAKSLRHWPRRRFRVEGSSAGNSRMLRETAAWNMQQLYGGKVVELIPPSSSVERKTVYEVAAMNLGECSWCKAAAGAPCVFPDGSPRHPHGHRENPLNVYELAARELGECPWCKAKPGAPCTASGGAQIYPHTRRIKK
jgi:hypothetical protein